MKVTFLGTGSAAGVPVYGCGCIACERARTLRDARRRPACIHLQVGETRLLIDAGLEDLADRMPRERFDAILLTHYHMDHVQGLFRLRWGIGDTIPVYGPDDEHGCDDLYKHPGLLDFGTKATAFGTLRIGDTTITPLPLVHSRPTLGYAIEGGSHRLAYLTDTRGLEANVLTWLRGFDPELLVLDCCYPPVGDADDPQKFRNHNDLTLAIDLVEKIGASETMLIHIDHTLDRWLLENPAGLPEGISVARDCQSARLSDNRIGERRRPADQASQLGAGG